MRMRGHGVALLLSILLLAPLTGVLDGSARDGERADRTGGIGDGAERADVRLIEPDPDSVRSIQPDSSRFGATDERRTEASTRIGTVGETGWDGLADLDPRLAIERSDLSLIVVDGAVDLWTIRGELSESVVVRAHIPPSGFLVQGSDHDRAGLSAVPGVVASHPVPVALMIEESLRDSMIEGGETLIPIQATGWRDSEGTPQAVFEAPGLIGHLGRAFAAADPSGHAIDIGRYEGAANASTILALASDPAVAWIASPPEWQLHNDRARGHMRIADAATAFITDLNGSGQLVAVADSGLDQDHGDMNGRIEDVVSVTFNDASTEDLHSGHGTHVACTVLGDGSRGGYAGVAPEARLYFQAMEDDSSGQFSGASMDYMLRTAYNEGAFVHTNSWGSGTNHNEYTTSAEDVDSRTSRYDQFWSYDGQTVLFSAGNDGQTGISPPATAKNSIAVANHHNRGGSAPDSLAQSSSRGPVDDGRIKPDIAAPGSWVRSCKSQDATDTGDATWTSTWYLEYSGTSMAAPNAAGASALIREYLTEVAGRPSPQGALIKSMLILGAEDMGGRDIPNSNEGWGRVNLVNSLVPGTDVGVFVDDRRSLRSGQEMIYSFNVTRAWSPFKAVLAWSDYEGNTWATKQLQNDLDLTLTAPDGTVYLGNDFANGRSATGGTKDDTNNVEVVLVDSAQMGVWTLKVKDASHGGGRSDQPFALAVRGVNVNDLRSDPIVLTESFRISSEIPQVGDEVTLTVPIANQGSGRANDLAIRAEILGESLLGEETLHLGPGETRYIDWDWTPQSEGSKTLRIIVDPTDSIEESDEDNNVVDIPILVSAPGVRLDVNSTILTVADASASTTRWDFRLRNTALIPTNATIATSKPVRLGDSAEMDWFSSFGSTAMSLNGSQEVWIPFTLVHPSPPERGVYRMTVTATDVDNGIDFPLQVDLNVPVLPDVRFTRPFTTGLPVSPIQNTSFEVTVHNDGNGAQGYDLTLEAPDGWHLGLDELGATPGASGGSTGSILQDGSRQVAITVVPPSDLTLAGVSLTGRLIVTAQSDAAKTWSLDLPLVVASHDALSVDLQTSLSTLKADARLSLMFEVENDGNRDVVITPQVTPPGGWSVVGSVSDFDMEVGETAFWRLTLKGNGQASAGDLAIRFMSGEQLAAEHSVTLDVDDPISASLAFNRVVLADGSTATTPLGAGDHETGPPGFVLEWTVANDGTVAWTPTAVLRAPGGDWYASCSEMAEVEPGGFASAVCSIIIPNDLAPGSEPILTVEIDAGGVALNDTLSLRIAERSAVTFTTPDATGLAVGVPTAIEVEVTNSGNVRIEHRVQVEALEGWTARLLESEVVTLQPGETRSLDIELTPAGSRSAEIAVRLMGDGDSVAFHHSFTATSVDGGEGASGGVATVAMIGALVVVIAAVAIGIAIVVRREADGGPPQGMSGGASTPAPALPAGAPGAAGQPYGGFKGFQAIIEQQQAAASGPMPPPPAGHGSQAAHAIVATGAPAAATPAVAAAPPPEGLPADVTPTPAEGFSESPTGVEGSAAGVKQRTAAPEASVAPAVAAAAAPAHQSEPPTESPIAPPVSCWACAEPIVGPTLRGCPGCGARYHPLSGESCAHAAVAACRNCGADPSTFVEVGAWPPMHDLDGGRPPSDERRTRSSGSGRCSGFDLTWAHVALHWRIAIPLRARAKRLYAGRGHAETVRAQRLPMLLIVGALLLSMASPLALATGGREAAVSLSADSLTKEAKPGEPAEYIITVSNDGSDDITVSLSTSEGQNCQGFSSAIEQIPGTIASGASEDVTMTVNVTQGADGECETTVRVSAQVAPPGAPGAPAQDELTVTTTVGDGGGSGAFAISLSSPQETQTYAGDDLVSFVVDVENTGQTQATVEITLDQDSACRIQDINVNADPGQVTVAPGATESVDVHFDTYRGNQTRAGDHCVIVRGEVTNDPNPERASDNLSLTLKVPEIHACDAMLLRTSDGAPTSAIDLAPGESKGFDLRVDNEGNSGWTVGIAAGGSKSGWIQVQGSSSQLVAYGDFVEFSFIVTADASIEAGGSTVISLQGKDGSVQICDAELTVTLGQNHDGTLTLSQSSISKMEPGSSHTIDVTVRNTGNGVDTFDMTAMPLIDQSGEDVAAADWATLFSNSSIRLESHLANGGDAGAVQLTVTAPVDALADDGIRIPITLYGSDSEPIVSVDLFVTVAEVYAVTVDLTTNDTTGGSYQTVSFPITITNDGNIADTYRLDACDGSNPLSCDEPGWPSSLTDEAGTQLSQIAVPAGESVDISLDVSLQATREAANKRIDLRVTSLGSPSIVLRESVTARVSIYSYEMAIGLIDPGDDVDSVDVVLPPTGNTSIDFWIENIGNSSYADKAVITVTGLEDFVERRIIFNGSETTEHIPMPRPGGERVHVTIEFSVSEAAENGAAGTIQIGAASYKKPTDRNTIPALFTIRTVHDLSVEVVGGATTVDTVYPRSASFLLRITNSGNIAEEVEVFTSEGLRGWTVDVEKDSFALEPGEARELKVVAKPPSALDVEDRFQFTVVARPEGQATAAQPLDLVAVAKPAGGLLQTLGLSDQQQTYVSYGAFAAIGILILGLLVRSRRDAQSIREAMEEPRKQR